jgi:hypothetical protein
LKILLFYFITGKKTKRFDPIQNNHNKLENHRQLMALRNHPAHIGLKLLYKQKDLGKDELLLLAKVCVDDITLLQRHKRNGYDLPLPCACRKLDFVNYF